MSTAEAGARGAEVVSFHLERDLLKFLGCSIQYFRTEAALVSQDRVKTRCPEHAPHSERSAQHDSEEHPPFLAVF